jgi:hypothetical protein
MTMIRTLLAYIWIREATNIRRETAWRLAAGDPAAWKWWLSAI